MNFGNDFRFFFHLTIAQRMPYHLFNQRRPLVDAMNIVQCREYLNL